MNIPTTFNNQQIQNIPSTQKGIDKNVILKHSMNDSINLILNIPLLNQKYEKITIELKKENKDIKKQFEKLKNKFLKIKKIAFSDETESKNVQHNLPNFNTNTNNQNMQNQRNWNQSIVNKNQQNLNQQSQKIYPKPSAQTILYQIKNEFKSNN